MRRARAALVGLTVAIAAIGALPAVAAGDVTLKVNSAEVVALGSTYITVETSVDIPAGGKAAFVARRIGRQPVAVYTPAVAKDGTHEFTLTIRDLDPGWQHDLHVLAIPDDPTQTAIAGGSQSVTTLSEPNVETSTVTGVTSSAFDVTATVTAPSGDGAVRLVYAPVTNPDAVKSVVEEFTGIEAEVELRATGLALFTQYTARVEVTDDPQGSRWFGGTDELSVTTLATRPANTVAPTLTGTPVVNKKLAIDRGTWTGAPAPTFTYSWYRSGVEIPGATGRTYKLTAEDLGKKIVGKVTATNEKGSKSVKTAFVKAGSKPVAAERPVITGTAAVKGKLTVSKGTWTVFPKPTYTYQWFRNGNAIAGATKASYKVVAADAGRKLTAKVTATNQYGSKRVTAVKAVKIPKL
jgi:hypothetical protein